MSSSNSPYGVPAQWLPQDISVERISRKAWDTKKVRIRGHTAATYNRAPRGLHFVSPLVNDRNQDFCGGWHPCVGDADPDEVLVERVIAGQKPLAQAVFTWPSHLTNAAYVAARQTAFARVEAESRASGLPMRATWDGADRVVLEIAQVETLGALFDLPTLAEDYRVRCAPLLGRLGELAARELEAVKDVALSEFLGGKWPNAAPWITGLVLGYPVENTVSLLQGLVR